MEMFLTESLTSQMAHLMKTDETEEMQAAMDQYRSKLEELFAAGRLKNKVSHSNVNRSYFKLKSI